MNSRQLISAFEKDITEIMRQLKERLEAPLPEKLEKLDESIRSIEAICSKYGQDLKRMREVEFHCKAGKQSSIQKFQY